jgi:hypothetical protein
VLYDHFLLDHCQDGIATTETEEADLHKSKQHIKIDHDSLPLIARSLRRLLITA